jgi:hypothetical protein
MTEEIGAEETSSRSEKVGDFGIPPKTILLHIVENTEENTEVAQVCMSTQRTSATLPLIIGFDAEWFEDPTWVKPAEKDFDPKNPAHYPRNIILSYQYACRLGGRQIGQGIIWTRAGAERRFPDLSPAQLAKYQERVKFSAIIGEALESYPRSVKGRRKWPKNVLATAHWTRADFSAMGDFDKIKGQFDGVQKSYATVIKPYEVTVKSGHHSKKVKVSLLDTQLLVPPEGGKALEVVGRLYNFKKLDPGTLPDGTKYIAHMDRLLVDNPEHYETYAIRDAEISALHVERMLEFSLQDLGLEIDLVKPPITLGAIATKYLLKVWKELGIDEGQVNGFRKVKQSRFNKNVGSGRLTTVEKDYLPRYKLHKTAAELSFHGGRNECFWYGPTPVADPNAVPTPPAIAYKSWRRPIEEPQTPGFFREFDLTGAYATCLSSLKIPDYNRARPTQDLEDFKTWELGFARVKFTFPPNTRFPCLPVLSLDEHGLIYPITGESYATSPEIVLAKHLGAEIEILDGVVIPWAKDDTRPFEIVISELSRRRKEHEPGTIQNQMYKLLGNAIYGKQGQGITGATSYDTRIDGRVTISPSPITNPFFAAYVTGMTRALVSEFIASIPDYRIVVSVTTDGFLTNASMAEISLDGPTAWFMIEVRGRLDGKNNVIDALRRKGSGIIEQKYEVPRVLPWRTRGVATLVGWDWIPGPDEWKGGRSFVPITEPWTGKPKLAMSGMRAPDNAKDRNEWFVGACLTREPGFKYPSREFPSFPLAHRLNLDHQPEIKEKSANFEYDFKRRPLDPEPQFLTVPREEGDDPVIVQHLSWNTIPWNSVEEFNNTRRLFEQWRHERKGQLRTLTDWNYWVEYQAGTAASKGGVRRKGGVVDQARRIFLHAYARKDWGLPGGDYKRAAELLTACGYPTKEQNFKDTRRITGAPPENTIPMDAPGVKKLVTTLRKLWSTFEWQRLVSGEWRPSMDLAA